MQQRLHLWIAGVLFVLTCGTPTAWANYPSEIRIDGYNMAGDSDLDAELDALLAPEVRPLSQTEQKVLDESLDESDAVEEELTRAGKLKPRIPSESGSNRDLASKAPPKVIKTTKKNIKKDSKRRNKQAALKSAKKSSKTKVAKKAAEEPPPTPIPVMTKEEKKELLNPTVVTQKKRKRNLNRNRNIVRIDFKEK